MIAMALFEDKGRLRGKVDLEQKLILWPLMIGELQTFILAPHLKPFHKSLLLLATK